ncbi:MAG: pilus assembly FimT family protein [Selenomonadaceae bacterium]
MKERGATIIELVCILAIISVLSGYALPRLPGILDSWQIDYEAACLAADLRWMQERTRSMQRLDVRFEGRGEDDQPQLYIRKGDYRIVMKEKLREHKFPPGLKMYVNQSRIAFDTEGRMNPPLTILLLQGGKARRVIIDIVGRIRVERNL